MEFYHPARSRSKRASSNCTRNFGKERSRMASKPKNVRAYWLLTVFFITCISLNTIAADTSWSLKSPKGTCEITVLLNGSGELSYSASLDGKAVLQNSPLGLRCD